MRLGADPSSRIGLAQSGQTGAFKTGALISGIPIVGIKPPKSNDSSTCIPQLQFQNRKAPPSTEVLQHGAPGTEIFEGPSNSSCVQDGTSTIAMERGATLAAHQAQHLPPCSGYLAPPQCSQARRWQPVLQSGPNIQAGDDHYRASQCHAKPSKTGIRV